MTAGAGTSPHPAALPCATLSVVVPTLDEAEHLPRLLADLETLVPEAELVIVDGGSRDGTADVARRAGATVVRAEPGRGTQLRAGAEASSGDWLFFVHADCRLDAEAAEALRRFVTDADPDMFAHYGFGLEGGGPVHRFIELGQRLRERWLGLVYGDQGLVVSRALYRKASGYPEWPLMEDVEMVRRLEARGRRVALPVTLVTSPRRYDEEGGLLRWMRNVVVMGLFQAGVDPRHLVRWYGPRRAGPRGSASASGGPSVPPRKTPSEGPSTTEAALPRRLVGVFAKAPTPGRVKTRLAADVGHARATEIYRGIGRDTVDALRGGPYRLVVFVDPPRSEAFREVGRWLDPSGIELRGQREGDLGDRMVAALGEALEEVDQALLVGADIPGIDRATVTRAFAALSDHDAVLGPATDGGYYLVGLSRPCPALFRDIPWSSAEVLSRTLERAEAAGVSVALLDEMSDIDTVDDLSPELSAEGPRSGSP